MKMHEQARTMVRKIWQALHRRVKRGLFYESMHIAQDLKKKLIRAAKIYDKARFHKHRETPQLEFRFPETGWKTIDVAFDDCLGTEYSQLICIDCEQEPFFDSEGEAYCPICE